MGLKEPISYVRFLEKTYLPVLIIVLIVLFYIFYKLCPFGICSQYHFKSKFLENPVESANTFFCENIIPNRRENTNKIPCCYPDYTICDFMSFYPGCKKAKKNIDQTLDNNYQDNSYFFKKNTH